MFSCLCGVGEKVESVCITCMNSYRKKKIWCYSSSSLTNFFCLILVNAFIVMCKGGFAGNLERYCASVKARTLIETDKISYRYSTKDISYWAKLRQFSKTEEFLARLTRLSGTNKSDNLHEFSSVLMKIWADISFMRINESYSNGIPFFPLRGETCEKNTRASGKSRAAWIRDEWLERHNSRVFFSVGYPMRIHCRAFPGSMFPAKQA